MFLLFIFLLAFRCCFFSSIVFDIALWFWYFFAFFCLFCVHCTFFLFSMMMWKAVSTNLSFQQEGRNISLCSSPPGRFSVHSLVGLDINEMVCLEDKFRLYCPDHFIFWRPPPMKHVSFFWHHPLIIIISIIIIIIIITIMNIFPFLTAGQSRALWHFPGLRPASLNWKQANKSKT